MQGMCKILACFGLGILAICNLGNSTGGAATANKRSLSGGKCLTENELANAVLSLSGTYSKAQEAGHLLRKSAKRSSKCRQRIIVAVMKAMDKPNLDIARDQASDDLWTNGAILLGDLKAARALDLLLSHITMDDHDSRLGMIHQPALEGIIRMGPIAIPKLRVMLRNSPDREVRKDAVYCLAWIGGASARRVLQQAFPLESDPCVKHFISISISTIDIKSGGLKTDRGQWFVAFLCHSE